MSNTFFDIIKDPNNNNLINKLYEHSISCFDPRICTRCALTKFVSTFFASASTNRAT